MVIIEGGVSNKVWAALNEQLVNRAFVWDVQRWHKQTISDSLNA